MMEVKSNPTYAPKSLAIPPNNILQKMICSIKTETRDSNPNISPPPLSKLPTQQTFVGSSSCKMNTVHPLKLSKGVHPTPSYGVKSISQVIKYHQNNPTPMTQSSPVQCSNSVGGYGHKTSPSTSLNHQNYPASYSKSACGGPYNQSGALAISSNANVLPAGPPALTTPGVPTIAKITKFSAPVHIDVGGMQFTTTLETLTKYPTSLIAKLFNGSVPIVLDSFKQHYFLNRDGKLFRHILNFLRNDGKLILPTDFKEFELLQREAEFFEIHSLVEALAARINNGGDQNGVRTNGPTHPNTTREPCPPAKRRATTALIVDNLLAKKMNTNNHTGNNCQTSSNQSPAQNIGYPGVKNARAKDSHQLSSGTDRCDEQGTDVECLLVKVARPQVKRDSSPHLTSISISGKRQTIAACLGFMEKSSQNLSSHSCEEHEETDHKSPDNGSKEFVDVLLAPTHHLVEVLQSILAPKHGFELLNSSNNACSSIEDHHLKSNNCPDVYTEYIFVRNVVPTSSNLDNYTT